MCPHCQSDARFVGWRSRVVTVLMGRIRVRRAYYHCKSCRRGCVPRDQKMGVNHRGLSPAAQEVTTLTGTVGSFAQAAERLLRKLCGLRLSESTVERTTEDAGRRLAALLEDKQTFGDKRAWSWNRDRQGRTCAYVSLDHTGVPQQGPGASRAECRMAGVAMLYNPRLGGSRSGQAPPHQVRCLAGFYDLKALGLQLRRQAAQVGWDAAEVQIALSDGGAGLEDFFRVFFPKAHCILDFWHVKEHLVQLAQAWFPAEDERQAWLDEQCHRLKHEGGRAVLEQLDQMDVAGCSPAVQEAHRQHTQYFRNHTHRMDYPTYVANGWQIGSGPVESACKQVVGARLKGSGMRWGEDGSDAVCHLRALWYSEPSQWESFWKDHPN